MTITVLDVFGITGVWRLEKNFHRTYSQPFKVLASTSEDPATINEAVLTHISSSIGSVSGVDTAALLTGMEARQSSDSSNKGLVWDVTVTWDTQAPDPSQSNTDPTDNPPVVSCTVKTVDIYRLKDLDGVPTINKAGDPIEGLVISMPMPVITWEVNTLTFNEHDAQTYSLKTNSDSWRSYSAGELLLESLTASKQHQNGITFWKRTYTLVVGPKDDETGYSSWTKELLNAGFNKLVGGVPQRILDRLGQPVSVPRPLKADGSDVLPMSDPSWPIYLPFRVYDSTSFVSLFGS